MGTERKRKVSLFDVVDETSVSAKISKSNGSGAVNNNNNIVNRWNGRPYSQRYYEILEKRRSLPVWHQKEEFLQVLKANQTLILVGETGSGKTTQVGLIYSGLIIFVFCVVGIRRSFILLFSLRMWDDGGLDLYPFDRHLQRGIDCSNILMGFKYLICSIWICMCVKDRV